MSTPIPCPSAEATFANLRGSGRRIGRACVGVAILLVAQATARAIGAQSVTSSQPGTLTVQGGQSAMFTIHGTGLLALGTLQVTSIGTGAATPGASATFSSSSDTQRRVTFSATTALVAGQSTVRAQDKNGAWVALPVTITTVAAPNDAAITITGLQLTPSQVYSTATTNATVTLSDPPLAPLVVELITVPANASSGSVLASGTVSAGSTSGTLTLPAQAPGVLVVRARRPPYTTGPVDTVQVYNSPPISSLAFAAPLLGGVNATLQVNLQFQPALGGVLKLTSSTNMLFPTATVQVAPYQSTLSVPVQVSSVPASVSGTLTAMFGASIKTLPFTIQGTMATPPITAVTPAAATTTGGLPVSMTIGLGAAVSGSAATLKVTSGNPSVAGPPVDVVIPVGANSVTFTVPTSPVGTTTSVPLTFALGTSTATSTVTVNPPHPASIAFTPPLHAGQPVTGKVTLNGLVGGPPGVVVSLTSATPQLATPPASVTVLPGAFEQTFVVQTTAAFATPTQSVGITGTTPLGSASGGLVLQRTTGVLSGLAATPSQIDGGASATGTVSLDLPAKAGGSVVSLSSSSSAVVVPASVTVPAGATSQSFSLNTAPVTGNTVATLTANDGLAPRTTSITVKAPIALASLSAPTSVDGGQSFMLHVAFTDQVPAGTSVSLASSNAAAIAPSAVVTSASGASVAVTVTTTPVLQDAVVTLTATWQGTSRTAAVTVRAPATVQSLTMTPGITWTSGSATAVVALNRAVLAATTVTLSSSNPGALPVPATLTIPQNQGSASLTVTPTPGPGATVFVTAALNGTSASDTLVVTPYVATISLQVPGLPGRDTLAAGASYPASLHLSAKAPAGGLTINLSSNAMGLLSLPASVTVPTNGTNVPLTISAGSPVTSTTVVVTVAGGGYTLTRQFVVKP